MTSAAARAWTCLVLAGALATALLLAQGCGDAPPGPPIQVMRIERDLLEPGAWRPLRVRPDAPPLVEILCPNVRSEVDGADMPALVLPPPGEVELVIAAGSTPARLVARVGVDQYAFKNLTAAAPRARIAFEVRAGERVLAREVIELVSGQHARNAWVDLGGKEGLALDGPATLTLRTEALLPDDSPTELPLPFHAGFGGLRLERRLERERTRATPERPNVVLVVMDTLRADRLSAYGYGRPTAPRLERLAARGVRFDACYSSGSWTWPATASLLTGLTPMEHGLVGRGSSFLPEQAETLAEALQSAGFTTAAWSGNPIVSAARNFDQGFERYTSAPEAFQKTDVFFEDVRSFLRANAGTRFFLYLHLTEPHEPLAPLDEGARVLAADVPLKFRAELERVRHETDKGEAVGPDGALRLDDFLTPAKRAWAGELYDAAVWSGDHWLGALLDELGSLALDDRTIVAFTADHGEELFERGFLWHGQSLRRELVHVPLVVAGPGVPPGKSHAGLFSSRLVAPMLASLAGVPFAGDEAARRTLTDPRAAEELVLFTTTKGFWKGKTSQRLIGLTDGKWKLELAPQGAPWGVAEPAPGGDVELFRVDEDPAERADLAARHPEEVARLRKILLERVDMLEKLRIGVDVPAGEATSKMLEQIGYGGGEDDER